MSELPDTHDKTPSELAEFMVLPENCIPEWGFSVVGFLDEEGVPRFESHLYGEPGIATLIGVLHIATTELTLLMIEDADSHFETDD